MSHRDAAELWELLRARADDAGVEWLEDAAARVGRDPATLATVFPAVGRQVGRQWLLPDGAGHRAPGGRQLHRWTVDDAGRAVLLVAAGERAWGELEDLYRFGDAAERRGVLRALHLLPPGGDPARHRPSGRNGRPREARHPGPNGRPGHLRSVDVDVELGLRLVEDAIRTNDPRLVAAALGPYAVARLGDAALEQAVLKCVFVGVPLDGIEGLADRATPALARMLAAYARERVAAGRDVPPDIWPLVEAHPPHDELAALEAELDHPFEGRRRAAAAALAQRAAHDHRDVTPLVPAAPGRARRGPSPGTE